MAEKEGYRIENIYQGGYSTFSPEYGDLFTGYHVPAGELGAPTKADTANQIAQVNALLNQGMVPIEVGALNPDTFDQIPKQHFKEINRLAKLTGAKISLHAPIIEPSGVGEQGWSENNRVQAENRLKEAVDRAIEMSDEGRMPITIHSAGIPGTERMIDPETGKPRTQKLLVINQESGKMMPLEQEKKYYPYRQEIRIVDGKKEIHNLPMDPGGEIRSPEEDLRVLNHTQWDDSLSQLIFYKEGADRIISENAAVIAPFQQDVNSGKLKRDSDAWTNDQKQAWGHIDNAETYLQNTQQSLTGLFQKAYKFGSAEEKVELEKASKKFAERLNQVNNGDVGGKSKAIQGMINDLRGVQPDLFVPVEKFALKHSSETFANVAYDAWKKNPKKAPMISIENLYPGFAFAYGDEMRNLIETSRGKFVEKAKAGGMSGSAAKKKAEELIGMTFDVGHLNVAKKHGYTDEDLRKEAEKIAPLVKHVHLTDNFGYSDSHLAPGMGNVPFKEHLKELEKAGVLDKVRKVVEAPGFVQHFGASPHPYVLEAMGSPIYGMEMAPSWNQTIGYSQGYYPGMGPTLPTVNFETWGGGFSNLPMELGGQQAANGARTTGRGME